jgi:hypothetical protein
MKKNTTCNLLIFSILLLSFWANAQKKTDSNAQKGITILSNFSCGIAKPGKDLAIRFGTNNTVAIGVELMTNKRNWIVGSDFSYFFSKKVNEDPLAKLINYDTYIYGNDKGLSSYLLRERGFIFQGYIGKLFSLHKDVKRSGFRVTLGAGYMQHKIRLQDDSRSITQLSGDYKKGYDRLTGGLSLSQYIGYQYLSNNRRVNFSIGFDLSQGFTKSLRDWDFDLKSKNTASRIDLLYGIRATWTLPFYIGDLGEKDEY